MAKRGERRPFTVRFRFEGAREWALGSFLTREAADEAAGRQRKVVGPNGETCEAWVVER